MKLIESYDEISPLYKKYLKPGIKTNHFMSENEYKAAINEKALYFHEWSSGNIFLKNREKFFKLTYQLLDLNEYLDVELPKKTIMEIVKRNTESGNYDIESFWEKNGFKVCLKRVRMLKKLDASNKKADESIELCENIDKEDKNFIAIVNNDFTIKPCTLKEKEDVVKLLNECFLVYTGCIPNDEEIKVDLENNFIIGAFENDNKLVGVLHFSKKKSISEIRHLAVSRDARGRGIASALILKYHEVFACEKAYLWVSENNEIAKRFYRKNGYEADGWISNVLANFDM